MYSFVQEKKKYKKSLFFWVHFVLLRKNTFIFGYIVRLWCFLGIKHTFWFCALKLKYLGCVVLVLLYALDEIKAQLLSLVISFSL